MSPSTIIACYGLGAAALAFWSIARFPQRGPKSVLSTFAAMFVAGCAMSVSQLLFDPVAETGRYGPGVAMLLVFLPGLTAAFWAAGCMLRTLSTQLR